VEGPTLAAHLRGTPVSAATLSERLLYIDDVCTAVSSLHSHTRSAGNPVLHRDLTPANCIVHATRGIVLIDISGMRLVEDGFDPQGRHTPAYTAPEVLRAPHEPRHPSSDLYAVGAVAVFVLTGQKPSTDPEDRTVLPKRLSQMLEAAGAGSAEAMAGHLLELLHPDPAQRPSDILTWSRTLTALAQPATAASGTAAGSAGAGRGRTRRPLLAAAAGALAIGLAAAGGVYAVQHHGRAAAATTAAGTTTASTSTNNTLGPVRAASDGFSPSDFYSTSGRITSPSTGEHVRDCESFSGTAAKLPPGQTLVVSQHNLGGNETIRFLQVTFGFDKPQNLSTWSSSQYFNDQAVGQDMLIELIQLPLTSALVKADDEHRYDLSSALAAKGKVIAAVTVVHVKRHNPNWPCPEPT
jgi:serine/threonine protein kinase